MLVEQPLSCHVTFICLMYAPGEHAGVWFLDLKSGTGSTGKGQPPTKADVVMSMDSGDFSKMFAGGLLTNPQQHHQQQQQRLRDNSRALLLLGKLKPTLAFMSGKLKIKGDMTLAIKLEKLMGRMNKAKL